MIDDLVSKVVKMVSEGLKENDKMFLELEEKRMKFEEQQMMQMLVVSAPPCSLPHAQYLPTYRSSTTVLPRAWINRWFLISEQCGTDWQTVMFLCMIYTLYCCKVSSVSWERDLSVVSWRLEMKALLACCFIIFMAKLWKLPILSCSNNPLFHLWRSQQRSHPSI